MIERTVQLVQERVYDPPREVEVELNGTWVHALQRSWQLWDDGRGWSAEVEWTERHSWGIRTVIAMVPAERVRPDDGAHTWSRDDHAEDWLASEHLLSA